MPTRTISPPEGEIDIWVTQLGVLAHKVVMQKSLKKHVKCDAVEMLTAISDLVCTLMVQLTNEEICGSCSACYIWILWHVS